MRLVAVTSQFPKSCYDGKQALSVLSVDGVCVSIIGRWGVQI